MGQAAVLELLNRTDTARELPRLGGMARANGVVIVSERFWAFAGTDGSLREGEMPVAPRFLRRVPLVRGLVRLAASLSPVFRRTGISGGRERWFLALAVLAPVSFVFLPHVAQLAIGIAVTVAMFGWLLRGRT